VLVGPKLSKQKAADMAKAIEKEFALKSMLMLFKPGYEE
jgi:cell division septation protein DedD